MDITLMDLVKDLTVRQRKWVVDMIALLGGYLIVFGVLAIGGKWRSTFFDLPRLVAFISVGLLVLRLSRLAPKPLVGALSGALVITVLFGGYVLSVSSANDGPDTYILALLPLVFLTISGVMRQSLDRRML